MPVLWPGAARKGSATSKNAVRGLDNCFLYREVLERDFGWLDNVVRAKKPKHLPVVFTPEEAMGVIGELKGRRWLMGMQLYGGGLRLNECLRQRVKDVSIRRSGRRGTRAAGLGGGITWIPPTCRKRWGGAVRKLGHGRAENWDRHQSS